LTGVADGTLHDLEAAPAPAPTLLALGQSLCAEGRTDDAMVIFRHLLALDPADQGALRGRVAAHAARGEVLEALDALSLLKDLLPDAGPIMADVRAQSVAAVARYNALTESGDIETAEKYAAALVRLVPGAAPMLAAALTCNVTLGRTSEAARYARALLALEPGHFAAHAVMADACRETGDLDGELAHRLITAFAEAPDNHPLLQLRNQHDLISLMLRRPLTELDRERIGQLLVKARDIRVEPSDDAEWLLWEKHYRMMLTAAELARLEEPRPETPEPYLRLTSADGAEMDWAAVRARAEALGARAVFFVAADESYVNLYARWYVLSVLKYCDVPFMIMVHVIGGADDLPAIARRVGVEDQRLVFVGDRFDAGAVTTLCHDAPPKGLIPRPVAHFQCVRFQRLGALMDRLALPVFVSDIDLLLQRGVEDLLARTAGADLVINENAISISACSRLTANLLLLYPTPAAAMFVRYLKAFLGEALDQPEVSRWIDQIALSFARQHLWLHAPGARIDHFDTQSDINNVMYKTFQDHPFRFLSLYHGFDTSSLEDARVLGDAG